VPRPRMAVLAVVALLVISACGSSSPTQAPGVTQAPGATQAPATQAPATQAPGEATQAPASQPGGSTTGDLCAGMPTFSITNPEPSFPNDPQLETHFPASIDGSDASNVTSLSFLGMMCGLPGGAGGIAAMTGQIGAGIDWTTVTFGSADYTVDGDDITLSAFRTPGSDSNAIVQSLGQLAAFSGAGITGSVSTSSIGGKNVFVFTDSTDGSKSYAYPSGDTLIYTDTVTDDEAQKIFSALP
jgi:hypothetical protein